MNGRIISIEAGYGVFPDFSGPPEIPLGEQVKLRVNWSAQEDNTNWTSALVAYEHRDPEWEILDDQTERHIGTSDSGEAILNLFNMPTYPITFAVVLWGHPDYLYGSFPAGRTDWIQLDYKTITIVPHVELIAGSIETKELEVFPPGFGSERYEIPVSGSVVDGSDGKIHVWVKNTGNVEFHPCINWKVRSPSALIKDYDECKAFGLNLDDTHHFYESFERFGIDEVGDWTVEIELIAEETGVILDQWNGKLCKVEAQAAEGEIQSMQLEIKDTGGFLSIPVREDIPKGTQAKVHVHIKNTGKTNYHGQVSWKIRDNRGFIIPGGHYDHTSFEMLSPNETHEFWESVAWFIFNREGDHTIEVEFRADTGELLDTYSDKLCMVGPEVVPDGDDGEHIFSGIISGVSILGEEPIPAGEEINFQIGWEAETSALFEQINGWRVKAVITLNGQEEEIISSTLFGGSNNGVLEVSFPGVQENQIGHIILSCLKAGFSTYEEIVDEHDFTIQVGEIPTIFCQIDADCPPGYVCRQDGLCVPADGKVPWLPVILIAGGALTAAIALAKPKLRGPTKK